MGTKKKTHKPKKPLRTPRISSKRYVLMDLWDRHRRLFHWFIVVLSAILLLIVGIFIAFKVSPWPSAMLIRYEFDKGGKKTSQALEKHVPPRIGALENQRYRANDKDGYLDVFYPEDAQKKALPTVVWVHGGAWVSGDKDNVDNYLKILAAYGFTVVGVDYSIAPEHQYPLPLEQLNDALGYLQRHADHLHIDPNQIVLAGDSAGSQIVAQMATIITSPSYAGEMNMLPSLASNKLRAMLLNCGAYDLALADYSGPFGNFLHTVLWAYSGTRDFLSDSKLKQASVVNYVTKDFPPSFITAGNADPLEPQSKEFAAKLAGLGVPTTALFYSDDHLPKLPHEYQFNLDNADGMQALGNIMTFLRSTTVAP